MLEMRVICPSCKSKNLIRITVWKKDIYSGVWDAVFFCQDCRKEALLRLDKEDYYYAIDKIKVEFREPREEAIERKKKEGKNQCIRCGAWHKSPIDVKIIGCSLCFKPRLNHSKEAVVAKQSSAFELCPSFDSCNAPICPLDVNKDLRVKLDGEVECTAPLEIRLIIAKKYGIKPYEVLLAGEKSRFDQGDVDFRIYIENYGKSLSEDIIAAGNGKEKLDLDIELMGGAWDAVSYIEELKSVINKYRIHRGIKGVDKDAKRIACLFSMLAIKHGIGLLAIPVFERQVYEYARKEQLLIDEVDFWEEVDQPMDEKLFLSSLDGWKCFDLGNLFKVIEMEVDKYVSRARTKGEKEPPRSGIVRHVRIRDGI